MRNGTARLMPPGTLKPMPRVRGLGVGRNGAPLVYGDLEVGPQCSAELTDTSLAFIGTVQGRCTAHHVVLDDRPPRDAS